MPRALALDLLDCVLQKNRPLEEAFESHGRLDGLSVRDRALARNLAATTLRRLGQIDALIDYSLEKPLPPKAEIARQIIRLGICQIIFMRTPDHAAVDTAVKLAEARGQGPYKKLVNAILRRVTREGAGLVEKQDAERLNTSDWLWDSWTKAYGEETGRAIAQAHLREAPLDLSFKEDREPWIEKLNGTPLPLGGLRLAKSSVVAQLPGYDEGVWWVQDFAASLPAKLFGDVKGKRVIDLCAAPGGKTAQLASAGAEVIAVERSKARMARMTENFQRLGLTAQNIIADVTTWRPPELCHAVLLDAPCSATGTIRRHPDVARLKTPRDVEKLAETQTKLLAAAAEMVAPQGQLIYVSCSLEPAEGLQIIQRFLASGAPFKRHPIKPEEIGGRAEMVSKDGDLRAFPHHMKEEGGVDGFFAARLRRT